MRKTAQKDLTSHLSNDNMSYSNRTHEAAIKWCLKTYKKFISEEIKLQKLELYNEYE